MNMISQLSTHLYTPASSSQTLRFLNHRRTVWQINWNHTANNRKSYKFTSLEAVVSMQHGYSRQRRVIGFFSATTDFFVGLSMHQLSNDTESVLQFQRATGNVGACRNVSCYSVWWGMIMTRTISCQFTHGPLQRSKATLIHPRCLWCHARVRSCLSKTNRCFFYVNKNNSWPKC